MSEKKFHQVVPFLPVRDLYETIAFYKYKLGFYNEWFWEESDAGICRDELSLLFTWNPDQVERINAEDKHLELVWFVDSVDEICREFKNNEVEILREPQDEPWGHREFAFKDINGYYIRVSQTLNLEQEEPENSGQ